MIISINIDKLLPHKNNPRTDLGDFEELSDSIKENGIFQNLTVVPHEEYQDCYTVVIGHRRLAAAKEAGLTEVPCAVVEMDEKTQASTMLLENMQRSDLTVYEQAHGIQMCLDLGLTEEDVATKTGFSRSTVRRRVKMLELDQEKVKQVPVNATIEEFAELEEIENVETRNELLEFIGTDQFKFKVSKALDDQEEEKVKNTLVDLLIKKGAVESTLDWANHDYLYSLSLTNKESAIETINEIDYSMPIYFEINKYSLSVFTEKTEMNTVEVDAIKEERHVEVQERKDKIDKICEIEKSIRLDAINQYFSGIKVLTDHQEQLILSKFVTDFINLDLESDSNTHKGFEKFDFDEFEEIKHGYFSFHNLTERGEDLVKKHPLIFMLSLMQISNDYDKKIYYSRWNYDEVEYNNGDNKSFEEYLSFLSDFDYTPSDEYDKVRNGTHELFDEVKEQ